MSAVRTWMQIYLLCFLTLQQQTRVSSVDLKIPRFEKFDELRQRVEGHRAADYLLLPHIYRAFINAGSPLSTMSNVSVSGNCLSNLKYYYTALQRRKAWAWKMYDATGKQSSGVFLGATTWTGNYEECLDHFINYQRIRGLNQRPEKVTDVGPVTPHYCSVHMTHAPWMPQVIDAYQLPFPVPYSPFIVDVCVPQNCSELDIHQIVNAFLKLDSSGDNITVSSVTCHHRRPISEDVPALLSAIFLFLLLTLVVLGTAFDIFRRRRKLRVKYGPEITIGYDEETDKFGVLKILLTPRKRKGRRGTLSSSELLDSTLIKDTQLNGSSTDRHTSSRRRTVSECASGDPATRPLFQRMSSAPAHADLQDIPEDIEIKTLSERVVSPATAALGSGSVMSDDESTGFSSDPSVAEIGESRGNLPVLSDSDGSCSPVPCEREAGYNRKASIIEVRPSHRVKKLTSSENLFTDLLLSFSFRKNTRHILAEGSGDTLFCLNGVRVLSITWIVLGNVYGIIYQNPAVVDNHVSAVKMTQSLWMQMVINTTLAADSFFILSGTLGAYHFLKAKTREGKDKEQQLLKVMTLKEYGFMIVHRLVRIFPCYAVLLILGTNLMPYLGRGPRWSYEIDNVKICKQNWWSNALFINNFYDPDNMCQPHTYYLANDFQFFLISPLVLIPLLIKPKLGLGLIGFLVLIQIVVVSVLNQGINGNVLRMKENNYWSILYVKPYSRIGVYAIGMGLGYFLFVCDRQMKFRQIPLYLGWFLTVIVCVTLPYATYVENREKGQPWSGIETAFYEAFSRPVWGLALSWVIFTCSTGQGAFIGKFLSWNLFLPLCRITYGVFLLHPIIIAVVIESSHFNFYLNFGELLYTYIPLFACSYALAFVLISCVECPFTSFESYLRLRYKTWRSNRKLKKFVENCPTDSSA